MITQERLKEFLLYCPDTGIFTWANPPGTKVKPGDNAGSINNHRYIIIVIESTHYKAHRLAFLYMEGAQPKHQVDHLNHIRSDNRWGNLRCAQHKDNGRNTKLHSTNKSGVCGVHFNKNRSKWEAYITFDGDRKYLGRFKDKADAVLVRKQAEIKYGFHKNHGKPS